MVQFDLATVVGTIGPLAWVHFPRRLTDGTIVTNTYSDQDMQCPGDYEGGFLPARPARFEGTR
jgi:hypothetical protein